MCFPTARQELSDCALTYDLARPILPREFDPDGNWTLSPEKRQAIFKPTGPRQSRVDMECGSERERRKRQQAAALQIRPDRHYPVILQLWDFDVPLFKPIVKWIDPCFADMICG